MKTLDAAGHIAQQYPDAVCVSFQQPETSAGRLLKDFRSVAGSAYTAVRYPEDRFYLTDDGKSERFWTRSTSSRQRTAPRS